MRTASSRGGLHACGLLGSARGAVQPAFHCAPRCPVETDGQATQAHPLKCRPLPPAGPASPSPAQLCRCSTKPWAPACSRCRTTAATRRPRPRPAAWRRRPAVPGTGLRIPRPCPVPAAVPRPAWMRSSYAARDVPRERAVVGSHGCFEHRRSAALDNCCWQRVPLARAGLPLVAYLLISSRALAKHATWRAGQTKHTHALHMALRLERVDMALAAAAAASPRLLGAWAPSSCMPARRSPIL